jgi:maltooligosyltrehalose trehalohydrolase
MSLRAVWAPHAGRVEIALADRRLPMVAASGGWYEIELSESDAGADYRFSLDGGPPRPDPRSPWQPQGVSGPSRPVNHGQFPWRDHEWRGAPLASAVLYELHVGTFTPEGTFAAVLGRLDHLVELGVTGIELMPVHEFPGRRGWGYDGVLPYAPHHGYGGPEGLKRLIDACHLRGVAVVLDVVYNHLGPAGNHLPAYGPYLTDRYRTPWGQAMNFDGPGSDEVRRYFIDNALMWLDDYHVDGLRLDAVHAIVDTSATHFVEQLASEVENLPGHLGTTKWLIAESDLNDPRLIRRREVGGHGLDAQWNEDFHHALHAVLTGENDGYYADFGDIADIATGLQRGFVYQGQYSRHRRRVHGRPAGDLPSTRFVAFSQNHDQVGNRAQGDRLSRLTTSGRLRVAAALVCCSPFVPLLFQGEEWAASTPFQYFTDHDDPELARAVTTGRRREFAGFGWKPEEIPDPQDESTWRRSVLRWEELGQPAHAGVLDWYRRLLALRRAEPDLTDSRFSHVQVRFDEDRGWLVVRRGRICVAVNVGELTAVPVGDKSLELLLSSDDRVEVKGELVVLPSDTVAVLRS